jgi:uncharacterized membrane protein YvbJ
MPYCKECGKKLLAGDKFCPYCGTPVSVREISSEVKTRYVGLDASTWAVIGLLAIISFVLIAWGITTNDPQVPKSFVVSLGIGIAIATAFGTLVDYTLIKRRQITHS